MKQLTKDIGITILGYSGAMVLGFINGIVAARWLGPVGRGELAAIQVLPMLLTTIAGLGHPQSISYFTARHPERSGTYLFSSLLSSLVICIPLTLIGLRLQKQLLGDYGEHIRVAGLSFVFFIPISILYSFPWSTIYGLKRIQLWNILRLQPQIIYTISLFLIVSMGIKNLSYVVGIYLFGSIFICLPSSWFSYRYIVQQRLMFDSKIFRSMLPYSLISLLNFVPNALNQRLDQVFIAAMLPAKELGFYSVVVSWSLLLNPLMSALGANLFPRLVSISDSNPSKMLSFTLRWTILIIIVMASILLLLTPTAIPLIFGKDFLLAVKPGVILVIACIFSSLNLVLSDSFRGLNRPIIPTIAELVSLVITAIGLWLSLARYGIMAAASVSLISYFVTTLLLLYFLHRLVPTIWNGWWSAYCVEVRSAVQWAIEKQSRT